MGIKVREVAYGRLQSPDLDLAEEFLTNFGLFRSARTQNALYMRGSDDPHHIHVTELGEPRLIGFAYDVQDEADLDKVARLPGASAIEDIDEPGGGRRVRLKEPNGYQIEIVHGIERLPPIDVVRLPINSGAEPLRRANVLFRPKPGPTPIKRIAHAVLSTPNVEETQRWFQETLGLIASDNVYLGGVDDGDLFCSFSRVNRGDDFVDHHAFACIYNETAGLNHFSFEVPDIDAVFLDHEYLKEVGKYEHLWGIGRHFLGSQVFDYWADPWGRVHEHWADSDRLTAKMPTIKWDVKEGMKVLWGNPLLRNSRRPSGPEKERNSAMSAVSTALIIGGGIGGLTAAVALRQQGIAVDLVEIQKDWTVYGVGIIQPNNTLRALARVGLADPCVAKGFAFRGWRICDTQDNILIEGPASNAADPRYPPVNGIQRTALHTILVDAAQKSGAKLMLGRTAHIESNGPDAVDVRFSGGGEARYDIVIGCDGVASPTRQALFPDSEQPRFVGEGVWRYTLPRPDDLDWGYLFFGRRSKAGLVPLSSTQMYMLLVTPEDERFYLPETLAQEMSGRLAEYGGIIGRLREQIVDPAAVVYRPLTSMMLPEPWWKHRAIIIGDAAHATTPQLAQGAAIAIEDAVLLAELLGQGTHVEDVFRSFMSRRFQRTKYVVDTSAQLSAWEVEEWAGIHNPDARPGELFNEGIAAMIEEY